jgi:hypothetical protein
LAGIGRFIYGSSPRSEAVSIDDVYSAFHGEETSSVDSALKKMDTRDLLSIELKGPRIRPLGHGKACFQKDCIPEVVLGPDYISKKFSPAVVHIIVSGLNDEESGGTGFFCFEYPDQIITASHVLRGRTVKRILDRFGNEIPMTSDAVKMGSNGLDLAILECKMPPGIEPIRVEWDESAVTLGNGLMVFGYPKIALHHHSIAQNYLSAHDSLIISSTYPGCSGGPVLDLKGFAIGVVEQENSLEQKAGFSSYFSATPAYYLKQLS